MTSPEVESPADDTVDESQPQSRASWLERLRDSDRQTRLLAVFAVVAVLAGGVALGLGIRDGMSDDDVQARPAADAQAGFEVDLKPPTTKPEIGPEAQQGTEAGATAFALYWFDALNWSLSQDDSDLLASHTGAGCGQCSGYLISISRWRDEGTELEGGLTVPLELAAGPFSTTEPVQFAATFLTTPATLTEEGGTATDYPGGRTQGGMTVLYSNGRWQMTDLVIDASQAPPG